MSDDRPMDDEQAAAGTRRDEPEGSGRSRLARAALLAGYGAAAMAATAVLGALEPKFPRLVGD
jgi:hypothetical protein